MWDFDNVSRAKVLDALLNVQGVYGLPNIYVLETKPGKNFIAYSFTCLPFRKVVEIIAYTPHVDFSFFKYGVYRERFTLRVGPKCGRKPKYFATLPSTVKELSSIRELRSWVKYETLTDNYKSRRIGA